MLNEHEVQEQIIEDGGVTVFVHWDDEQDCYNAITANSGYMAETVGEAVAGAVHDEIRYRVIQKERAERESE